MTHPLDRLRAAIAGLPEVTASADDGRRAFAVAGRVFATVTGETLTLLVEDDGFEDIDLAGDPDWAAIEDRVARSWELAAPSRLLEAGGR